MLPEAGKQGSGCVGSTGVVVGCSSRSNKKMKMKWKYVNIFFPVFIFFLECFY